ncbi:MAG: hypothetical protein QNI84_08180 [Henriciella sp.]|nr:hypothetical protein [Henriciella sp.]
MTDLAAELDAWCASYTAAFSAYDAAAVSSHWAFPALILQGEHRIVFDTEAKFTRNTTNLLDFYRRQKVDRAERVLLEASPMGKRATTMRVEDRMLTPGGDLIATWQASYVLQKLSGAWRAVSAVADGETAAWAARGTPLGSK